MKLKCPFCKRDMAIMFDTPLCLVCDDALVYDMAVWLKGDIERNRTEIQGKGDI